MEAAEVEGSDAMEMHDTVEPGARWGALERARPVYPVRRYRFDRARLAPGDLRRLPENAQVEIDSDGCAYLAIGGERLLFAGDLARLLRTLALPASSLRIEDDELLASAPANDDDDAR